MIMTSKVQQPEIKQGLSKDAKGFFKKIAYNRGIHRLEDLVAEVRGWAKINLKPSKPTLIFSNAIYGVLVVSDNSPTNATPIASNSPAPKPIRFNCMRLGDTGFSGRFAGSIIL